MGYDFYFNAFTVLPMRHLLYNLTFHVWKICIIHLLTASQEPLTL